MKKLEAGKLPVLAIIIALTVISILLVNERISSEPARKFVAWTGLCILFAGGFYLLWDKDALRDASVQKGGSKSYSFSRVQLWWWTMIIAGSYLGIFAATGRSWDINTTCLVLLGISAATTAGGKMVDNQQAKDAGVSRHQDLFSTQGLMMDILSDENGLSIHRFQAFIFNISYGLTFVVTVFSDPDAGKFPEFNSAVLTLLGISSGAYVTMKMTEARPMPASAEAPSGKAGSAEAAAGEKSGGS